MAPNLSQSQSAVGPVTDWLGGLRRGDPVAAERVWETYFRRASGLARRLLHGRVRRTCEGEDVAASAFRSLYVGARAGRFPQLAKRGDLWALLAALTSHKCVDRMRHEGRTKRGGTTAAANPSELGQFAGRDDGPAGQAELADLRDRLFALLDGHADPSLRAIVQSRLAGDSIGDTALRLGCVRRTVERKLRLVEQIWEGGL